MSPQSQQLEGRIAVRDAPQLEGLREALRTLRKTMAALLDGWTNLSEADSAVAVASSAKSEASRGIASIKPADSLAKVEASIKRATTLVRKQREATLNHNAALLKLKSERSALLECKAALSAQLEQAEQLAQAAREELGEQAVRTVVQGYLLEAARHLLTTADSHSADLQAEITAVDEVTQEALESAAEQELSEADLEYLDALRKTLVESIPYMQMLPKVYGQLSRARDRQISHQEKPDIRQPQRPTSEEVHRYLGQLESFMVTRQEAQREALLADESATSLDTELAAIYARLTEQVDLALAALKPAPDAEDARTTSSAAELEGMLTVVQAQKSEITRHRDWLLEARFKVARGDAAMLPDVPESQRRKLRELRKALESFAYAIGRQNEAKLSLAAAPAPAELPPLELGELPDGILTWQACQAWYHQCQAVQVSAEKLHLSRGATAELLSFAVLSTGKQASRTRRRLHQLAASTQRKGSEDKACSDELRRVLNMAACAYQEGEHGDFPVY